MGFFVERVAEIVDAANGPAGKAMLHLVTDLPMELAPILTEWCNALHHRDVLTVDGFLSARRMELVSEGTGQFLTMYQLSDPAVTNFPRNPAFSRMPAELIGHFTLARRVLSRASTPPAGDVAPVGKALLQLVRTPCAGVDAAEVVRALETRPQVLDVSTWQDANEQCESPALVLAELRRQQDVQLAPDSKAEFEGWTLSAYRQIFPATGVLLPQAALFDKIEAE